MDLKECFDKRMLIKEKIDFEKIKKSLETAKHKIEIAKKVFNFGVMEETISCAYSAMFHAARALLFKDGIREKSHYVLFLYIKEEYQNKIEKRFINELNNLRLERHEITYGLERCKVENEEVEEIIQVVDDFILAVEKIIKK